MEIIYNTISVFCNKIRMFWKLQNLPIIEYAY